MKLISCHVENFGKLHDATIDFKDGVNAFVFENGWGKSTLCAFIRTMFYGLGGEGKRDDLSNERKRYFPWQGGAFGGSLSFDVNGKQYCVTRIFGNKLADDVFELRDLKTNLISNDYSAALGEELFKLNSESFMRSVFISQNDCANSQGTDDINQKLGNISDSIDLNRYALAEKTLADAANALSFSRKTGIGNRLKTKASSLRSEILAGEGLENTITEIEKRIEKFNAELGECKSEQSALNALKVKAAKAEKRYEQKRNYDEIKLDVEDKLSKLEECKAAFPGKIPTKEELEELASKVNEYNHLKDVFNENNLLNEEKEHFLGLAENFAENVPLESDINDYIKTASNLRKKETENGKYVLTESEEERLESFNATFETPERGADIVNDLSDKWALRCENAAKMHSYKREVSVNKDSAPKGKAGKLVFWLVLAIIFGGYTYLFNKGFLESIKAIYENAFLKEYSSYISAGLSFVCVIFLLLALFKPSGRTKNSHFDGLEAEIASLDIENRDIEDEVLGFLNEAGFDSNPDNANRVLRELLGSMSDYRTLYEKKKKLDANFDAQEAKDIKNEITNYLNYYFITVHDGDYESALYELLKQVKYFESLKTKSENAGRAKASMEALSEAFTKEFEAINIPVNANALLNLSNLSNLVDDYSLAKKLYSEANARFSKFLLTVNEADLTRLEEETDNTGIEALNQRQDALSERMNELSKNIADDVHSLDTYREKLDDYYQLKNELAQVEEEIAETVKKEELVSKTSFYLNKARESLTQRYIGPLLEGFDKYYEMLTGTKADDFNIDANLKVTKMEQGRQRDTEFLSYGYRDLIGLCMRLAMADSMYKDEKPLLVLDDPFVNLDAPKTEKGLKLLDKVANEYQVLYFTCK